MEININNIDEIEFDFFMFSAEDRINFDAAKFAFSSIALMDLAETIESKTNDMSFYMENFDDIGKLVCDFYEKAEFLIFDETGVKEKLKDLAEQIQNWEKI